MLLDHGLGDGSRLGRLAVQLLLQSPLKKTHTKLKHSNNLKDALCDCVRDVSDVRSSVVGCNAVHKGDLMKRSRGGDGGRDLPALVRSLVNEREGLAVLLGVERIEIDVVLERSDRKLLAVEKHRQGRIATSNVKHALAEQREQIVRNTVNVKLAQIGFELDLDVVALCRDRSNVAARLLVHIVGPHLLVFFAASRVHTFKRKLATENVGQLGSETIATTNNLSHSF
jgi:hypothetical protein